jgi:CheY-like chemotaxis protein
MSPTASDPSPYLLVVEDDGELCRLLKEHFEREGYRVETVENGTEALRRVMVSDFDAVVCDMVMPHMAGDMFYLAVKKVKSGLCDRFVFITGHGESPEVREFLNAVTERVISKPFNVEDLSSAVRQALAGGKPAPKA